MRIWGILLAALISAGGARAQEQWSAQLGGKPAQAPLVADAAPPAGVEVFVVLENGGLRAFQADGKPLWSADPAGGVAPGSQAAITPGSDDQEALLIVPGAGEVAAYDAAAGTALWKSEAVLGEGAVWAAAVDLDGDKLPDVIAAGATGTVAAFAGRDGKTLWSVAGSDSKLTQLSGAPCVADINDDGAPEIYAAGKEGVFALDATGKEVYFAPLDAAAAGAPIVTDFDDDGKYELYLIDANGKLLARDAENGDALWELKLDAGADARLATADLDQDEQGEILVAGKQIAVVSGEGKLLFQHAGAGLGVAVGDANSDGELEVIAATKDGLDLLNPSLAVVGHAALGSPSITAPVLTTINGASVVSVGEDNTMRVTRTGARLMPQLAPWTMPRRDASARGSALSPLKESDLHADGPQLAANSAPLGLTTSFEDAGALWKAEAEGGAVAVDNELKAIGAASIKVTPGTAELRVASPPVTAAPDLRRVNASVLAKGNGARAFLSWERDAGDAVLQELRPADTTPDGWKRLRISNVAKPAGAIRVRMVLASAPGAPTNWDDAQATGQTMSVPYVEVFYNQVGYEVKMPKRFTAASTFQSPQGTFRILNERGDEVHHDITSTPKRITGANGSDWGKYYWTGDFTAFDEPGKYRIEINIDGNVAQTGLFEIAPDLMWTHLYGPLTGAITARRCGEGDACATQSCAWDEGTTDGCRDVEHLRALNEIYTMILWRIFDKDSSALPPLAEELKWGADHILAHPEVAGAHVAAALAGAARVFPAETKYTEAVRGMIAPDKNGNIEPLDLFAATLDLYVATHDESLVEQVKKYYPGAEIKVAESVVRYESEIDEMALVSFDIGKRLAERADLWLKAADNPFGLCARMVEGKPSYFGADANAEGNTRFVLDAALEVAQAYRYTPKIEYQQFILDQFNWVLGNNPFGVSFVEGVGVKNLPQYAFARAKFPRGVPVGAVANGIMGTGGSDTPALDLGISETPSPLMNACPLGNTVAFLDALSNLKRIRVKGAQKAQP